MILVLNTGSSSVKAALFSEGLEELAEARVSGVGGKGMLKLMGDTREIDTKSHLAAIDAILAGLRNKGFDPAQYKAAAHRVVHGGEKLTAPCRITPKIRQTIVDYVPLAPLHNPPALAGIDAISERLPDLPQFASFDTAFHAHQDPVATAYALPADIRARGIRRYGFHGLSYAGLTESFGDKLPKRLLALHLGAGCSLCAILDGRSVATSMGYSPISGPTMATRSGDVDPGAVLRLAQEDGIEATNRLLNRSSGLLGLSGLSGDMRTLLATDTAEARFAVDHFCYWAARQAGSLIAAMHGIDALAFTGGIGENSEEIRQRIKDHLTWAGDLPIHIIPAEEERQIAKDALTLI
ncbi:acetate/propionate family kinase [Rhodalgimonas zhirmunskyi]|uniref:Acetate kinase n=1 Tax=Rhodalgimonas zhirmunskyi TaxID=2964767 RepID=A0AAJ1UA43_9RHOB|nr:acetate kinase [Rhodoalgimonas zhirmunskyi]MDQ2094048.1 acetate kinase [Rhodoalgimonas zhirmunskyi]